jgi:hypothetical protein
MSPLILPIIELPIRYGLGLKPSIVTPPVAETCLDWKTSTASNIAASLIAGVVAYEFVFVSAPTAEP